MERHDIEGFYIIFAENLIVTELKICALCFQVHKVIIEVQILKNIDNTFNHILSGLRMK